MFISNFKFAPNFTAIKRAQYDCKNANGEKKPITIYELEAKDLPYVSKFMDNFQMSDECAGKEDAKTKKEIMELAFKDAVEVCQRKKDNDSDFNKTRMFMAFDGNKSCGFMMCNEPKRNAEVDDKVHYSSRQKGKIDETELDWLATWSSKGGDTMKGIGKVLLNELFMASEEDNFKDIFLQSEIPDNKSNAHAVYNHLGFKYYGPRRTMGQNFFYMPILDKTAVLNDEVIPMHIDRKDKLQSMAKITNDMNRSNLDKASVNLDTLA